MDNIKVRASSLPELFDCPARWEAKHIQKRRLPSSANAVLGRAVHAGTATFDACNINGTPVSLDDVAGVVADSIHQPEDDVDWGEDRPQEMENIGIAITKNYCKTIAPNMDYFAVEATCQNLAITDLGIALTGTTDRVVSTKDGLAIADIKTGKSIIGSDGAVKTKGHAAQIAVYELLAEHSLGISINQPAKVIGLQVAKTDKGRRIGIGSISGGRELLLGSEGSFGLLEHAASLIKSGLFYGNPKSMMCDKKYCPIYNKCKWRI